GIMNKRFYVVISCLIGLTLLAFIAIRVRILTTRTKLIIGSDTTFVLGPVLPDGSVDFKAALNDRYSLGVKPEENAVVILDAAFRPEFDSPEARLRYYKYLGVPEPIRAKCIIDASEFAKQLWGPNYSTEHNEFHEQVSTCQKEPWERASFPNVAKWIDENREPLQLIELACRREKFYCPLVNGELLLDARLSWVQCLRSAARLLVARAMSRLSEGDLNAAWNDLHSVARLGRLLSQHPLIVGNLIGVAIEANGLNGHRSLLSRRLSQEQALRFLDAMKAIPEMPDQTLALDYGERAMFLEILQLTWQGKNILSDEVNLAAVFSGQDINLAMRHGNTYFDQLTGAQRLKSFQKQMTAAEEVRSRLYRRLAKTVTPQNVAAGLVFTPRNEITVQMTDLILGLVRPAGTQFIRAKLQAKVRFDLLRLGYALAAYRAEHREYPEKLEALTPRFLKEIPLDPFVDLPLHYQRLVGTQPQLDGFLLYSVDKDLKDNGGIIPDRGEPLDLVLRVIHE
ncbi:MAG: hypothetical protein JWM11_1512, partial [Planctomycetaceae bacterium]|nr:hypothetical protein [Planctomycetaceae bacterium]